MSVTIRVFQVGEERFRHAINTKHESVELRDEGNEILLTFAANARVRDHAGQLGIFNVEYLDGQPRWVYYETPLENRIVLGPDLINAEVEVSKRYIGKSGRVSSEAKCQIAA